MDAYQEYDEREKVRQVSKKWYPKSPKKFNSNLINEVHQFIFPSSTLIAYEVLQDTKYFDNVLWKFFHQDITSNHIELLICTVLYDIRYSTGKLIDKILSNEEHFQQLLERLLTITTPTKKSNNWRLQSHILLFINQLITYKLANPIVKKEINGLFNITTWANLEEHEKMFLNEYLKIQFEKKHTLIENCKPNSRKPYMSLKRRWIYNILINFMTLIITNSNSLDSEFLCYSESLIQLLLSCVCQLPLRMYFNHFLKSLRFVSCFHELDDKYLRLKKFGKLLRYFIYYPINDFTGEESLEGGKYENNFYLLQKIVYEKFSRKLSEKVNDFIFAPSIYNYSDKELKKLLMSFTLDDVISIAEQIQTICHIPVNFRTIDLISNSIIDEIYIPQYNIKGLIREVDRYNEHDLIDEFGIKSNQNILQSNPIPQVGNIQYLSMFDYMTREVMNLTYEFKNLANKHILQVLDRLKSTVDPTGNLKIKGTSKYFSKIESLKVLNVDMAELIFGSDKGMNDNFIEEELIVLVHLMKPNAYSPHERLNKYGVNMLRLKKVLKVEGKGKHRNLLINWREDDEFSSRFNYVIRLPPYLPALNKLNVIDKNIDLKNISLPSFLNDLFIGIDKSNVADFENQPNRPYKLMVDCIDVTGMGYEIESDSAKRRKTNDNSISKSEPPYLLKFAEKDEGVSIQAIDEQTLGYNFNVEQSKCLLSSISTGLTMIDCSPHSDDNLLQSIMHHLHLNFPNERTLIICPDDNYLKKIDLVKVNWFKMFANENLCSNRINQLFDTISNELEKVEQLSECIGLKDMGFGQSCETGILLYSKVQQMWENFLLEVKQDRLKIVNYPFKQYAKISMNHSFESNLRLVVKSYKNITESFQNIQGLAPLEKFEGKREELIRYITRKYSRFVMVTPRTLISKKVYLHNFDSVVNVGGSTSQFSSILPMINNSNLKRFIVMDDLSRTSCSRWEYLGVRIFRLRQTNTRQEFLKYYQDIYDDTLVSVLPDTQPNGGFKETHQIIPVEGETNGPVSIGEAEYTIALYQYMRLLGYPSCKISLIVSSPHQKALVEEIAGAKCGSHEAHDTGKFAFGWPLIEMADSCTSNDYIIVSAFGCNSKRSLLPVASKGIYIVGSYDISAFPSGHLTVVNGEMYGKVLPRNAKHLYNIEGCEHLRQYVDQMTAVRMRSTRRVD